MKTMRLRRDILLILLAVILAAFGTITPSIIKTNWTPITAISYLVIIAALVFAIWSLVKGLQIIYETEDTRQKEETKQLIKDTVERTLEELRNKNVREKHNGK